MGKQRHDRDGGREMTAPRWLREIPSGELFGHDLAGYLEANNLPRACLLDVVDERDRRRASQAHERERHRRISFHGTEADR